jgi:transcriptional regulator with XRE-family HTH domain
MAVDPVARVYGVVIRHLREDTGLSLNKAVKGHAFDSTYLSKIETGNRFPSAQVAETLDKALDSDLPSTLRAEIEQLRTRASAVDGQARDSSAEVIMDETRRRLMLSLGVLGVGAATVPAAVLEPIRQALPAPSPNPRTTTASKTGRKSPANTLTPS